MGAVFYLKRQISSHLSPHSVVCAAALKRSAWARAALQKLGGAIAYICVHCLGIRAKRGEGRRQCLRNECSAGLGHSLE